MSFQNICIFTCSLFLFAGCTLKEPTPQEFIAEKTASKEMLLYPQKLDFLTQNITPKRVAQEDFTYRYYAPWIRTHLQHTQKDASWANTSFGIKGRYYGENLQPISDEEIDTLIASTNFEAYGSINAHAIMIYNVLVLYFV